MILSAGGTGGHLFPGIALAEEFLSQGVEILFLGTKRGIEAKVLPQKCYSWKTIVAKGFLRKKRLEKILFPFFFFVGFWQSCFYLVKFKPNVVVGTGGYVCAAPILAAVLFRIPTVLLALDCLPSRTVRILEPLVNEVHTAFPESVSYFKRKEKIKWSGNPVRKEIGRVSKEEGIKYFNLAAGKKTLLIFGGSRGAHSINLAVVEGLKNLMSWENLQLIIQTGKEDFTFVAEKSKPFGSRIVVKDFIEKMEYAYAASDFVVSRAGAGVAEILACRLPSVLIPFPYAADNHQEYNARSLEKAGAAWVLLNCDLNGKSLSEKILKILRDDKKRTEMAKKAKELGKPEAAKKIVESIICLSHRNTQNNTKE